MTDAYELYKPLRNHLRKVALLDSLGVIRAYMQYMQFGIPFPDDIEVAPYFLHASEPFQRNVFEWELDVLAREVVLNASDTSANPTRDTLRRWSYFAGAANKLKTLENELVKLYPQGYVLLELHRIAHRQFPWQRRPNSTGLARYFKIFGDAAVDSIIQQKMGLTARDLYRIGLILIGIYLDRFALHYPPRIDVPGLDQAKLDRFLARFALDMTALKTETATVQELNENYAYVFNPLRIYPLVWEELDGRRSLIAPIPTFLYWRFTEGVYYEIRDEPGFSDAFGYAFQAYVGQVLERANDARAFQVYPESEYYAGNDRRDTVDWIVEDETAILFVESKTKRLQRQAKTALRSAAALEAELEKLAGFIVQVYKTIRDYRENRYPQLPYRKDKPLFPVVVTLEEWHAFGDLIQQEVERRVASKLNALNLPGECLQEMPYATCSVADFEALIQVISQLGVFEVMHRRAQSPEFRKWEIGVFLIQEFAAARANAKPLFPEVLDEL